MRFLQYFHFSVFLLVLFFIPLTVEATNIENYYTCITSCPITSETDYNCCCGTCAKFGEPSLEDWYTYGKERCDQDYMKCLERASHKSGQAKSDASSVCLNQNSSCRNTVIQVGEVLKKHN